MERPSWLLLDDQGARPIAVDPARARWAKAQDWPAFARLALEAPLEEVLEQSLRHLGSPPWELLAMTSEDDEEAWWLGHRAPYTWVQEPFMEAQGRLDPTMAEELAMACQARGAYLHHEPDTGQLYLALFERGQVRLAWCDTFVPGPSFSLTFHDDGCCTHEDPRLYALRVLDLPDDTPWLDRYMFIESMLGAHGPGLMPTAHLTLRPSKR